MAANEWAEWQPENVLVIGDNPDDELQAGKDLGMYTIQILRDGVKKTEGFDYYIQDFEQLRNMSLHAEINFVKEYCHFTKSARTLYRKENHPPKERQLVAPSEIVSQKLWCINE